MKRLCFDTESNYFKPATSGIGDLDYHREWIDDFLTRKKIRWDGAVVYDEGSDQYQEFEYHQADNLVSVLATADELISHSGMRHDLLILERICGRDRIAPLLQISHHDLFEICNWASVDELCGRYLPQRVAAWKAELKLSLKNIDGRYPVIRQRGYPPNWRDEKHFDESRLAKARYDVERTYAVWLALPPPKPENGTQTR